MEPLSIRTIADFTDATLIVSGDVQSESVFVSGISTDTRRIRDNELFIAISGINFDGHEYITDAFKKGAACVITQRLDMHVPVGKLALFVPDTLNALKMLAKGYRQMFNIPVVGITGSVGKTSVKDITASVLSQRYNTLMTIGNVNNEIGLPQTVFRLTREHEAAVFEMGMNHFGEISALTNIAKPSIAVISNIGASHIEQLGSLKGILKAKSEIFEGLHSNGTAVLNADDDMLATLKASVLNRDILRFGINNKRESDFLAYDIEHDGLRGTKCTFKTPSGTYKVAIRYPGAHMIYNALAAAAVGWRLGVSNGEIAEGIRGFDLTKMRMDVKKTNKYTVIDDCYNANPSSMKAAIDVLCKASTRKVAILGDMLELGVYADALHGEVGRYLAGKGIDIVVCIGTLAREICAEYIHAHHFDTINEFILNIDNLLAPNDTVLVKASRGMHFEWIVDKLTEVDD